MPSLIKRLAAIPPELISGSMGGPGDNTVRVDGLIASSFPQDIVFPGGNVSGLFDIDVSALLGGNCCGYRIMLRSNSAKTDFSNTKISINNGGFRSIPITRESTSSGLSVGGIEDRLILVSRIQLFIEAVDWGSPLVPSADYVILQLFGY